MPPHAVKWRHEQTPAISLLDVSRRQAARAPFMIVLIVEDQPAFRSALVELVNTLLPQARVLEAMNGAQAMQHCDSHEPTLVLMDVCLPDTDGIALTRRVREMIEATSVVVMSIMSHHAEEALEAGAVAFLSKDTLYSELGPLLQRVLR